MAREDRVARRLDPSLILPQVRSVVMVGVLYWPGRSGFPKLHDPHFHHGTKSLIETNPTAGEMRVVDKSYAQNRGILSSYAWGDDYHSTLQERLKKLGQHLNEVAGGLGRFYVDTGAVLERDFAERAGLGFVGKNSLLINPRVGSGFFIGELFSTVALPLNGDTDRGTMRRQRGEPGCGKCTRCKVACPTGAIVEDYVVDARKCISYLTIELKRRIPMELRKGMGNRIYGCDICQHVCPWNRIDWNRGASSEQQGKGGFSPLFGYADEDLTTPKLTELIMLDEKSFRERFKRSAVRRIGRERMARNAAVALGNVGGKAELAVVEKVAESDESELVREHASWAAEQIRSRLSNKDEYKRNEVV